MAERGRTPVPYSYRREYPRDLDNAFTLDALHRDVARQYASQDCEGEMQSDTGSDSTRTVSP